MGGYRPEPVEYLQVAGPEGAAVGLEGSRLTIGADPSNDMAITDDGFVSRIHAVLERHPAGWLLRDVGSRNGTYVNAERITVERVLRPGDEIRVGQTTLRLQTEAGPVRITLGDDAECADLHSASFVREGDYWTIVFAGRTSRVRDSKGMRYLALLLVAPDRELHVLELTSAVEGVAPDTGARSDLGLTLEASDAGAVLDARAKAEYRQRLHDLAEGLDEANRFNDPERAARASAEIDALTDQLTAAVGLGGRDRRAASATERARLNVTRAMRAALRRIAEADERAGNHLDVCLRTGVFCSYRPDPAAPTLWRTSG